MSHVMYIRGPGKRVVAEENWTESGSSVTASPVLYHHQDIVGSTVVTNTTNTASGVTRLRYDPYGLRIAICQGSSTSSTCMTNPTQTPVLAAPTKVGFTGHQMEDDVQLINMKGRMFDPKIARFLTPDPFVAVPPRGNAYDRYAYVLNNPLRFRDPMGFETISCNESGDYCVLMGDRPGPGAAAWHGWIWVIPA
jgi:RHS repeat-associated protein